MRFGSMKQGAIFKTSLFCYQSEGLPINESWSFRSSLHNLVKIQQKGHTYASCVKRPSQLAQYVVENEPFSWIDSLSPLDSRCF